MYIRKDDMMDYRDALEKLSAYCKCQKMQVRGIYEECNEGRCDDCDLCYMQGTNGERIESIEIAIKVLKDQIALKGGDAID